MNTASVPVLRTLQDLRGLIQQQRSAGHKIALVPTMGALHAGHLSLVGVAAARAETVIVTIFVNPTQFAPHEDFDRYPRTEDRDVALLTAQGRTTAVYAPLAHDMYRRGFATSIEVRGPALGLESDSRPHFFAGVATIVTKLLLQADADLAVFGEKDFQQLAVIRQVAGDLDIKTEIVGAPTLREADGLAMSSRNTYLPAAHRAIAGKLNGIMFALAADVRQGTAPLVSAARRRAELLNVGFDAVDYLEVRDAASLSSAVKPGATARVLVAARLGEVRLIDNCPV